MLLNIRITIVSDVCYPTVCDGVASILTNLVQELNAKGHQIQLIAPKAALWKALSWCVCVQFRSPKPTIRSCHSFRRAFLQIRKFNPEFILFLDPRFLAIQSIFFLFFFGRLFSQTQITGHVSTDNFQYLKILFMPYFSANGFTVSYSAIFALFR